MQRANAFPAAATALAVREDISVLAQNLVRIPETPTWHFPSVDSSFKPSVWCF